MALVNLEKVTGSLGAKTVLWELFSFNPPSLKLYVDLCAWSQFLSEILINNPGMIDELLDSLVLNQPRTAEELRQELAELCRGAADLEPILHSFQDKELLRIGVRDILGKDTHPRHDGRAERPGGNDPGADGGAAMAPLEKRFGVPLPGGGTAGRPAEPLRAAGPGQARRPRDELSQRSRFDADLRGRRPHRAAAGRHALRPLRADRQLPLLHRAGPAHHPGDELPRPDGPALPGGHAAAADGQVRQPGAAAGRVPPLLRGRTDGERTRTPAPSCGSGRR